MEIAKLAKRLASLPPSGNDDQLKGVARYLLSQLKIRFRPIWSEATAALAEMAKTRGDVVWNVIWDQLERTLATEFAMVPDLDTEEPAWASAYPDKAQPRTPADGAVELRCPNIIKTREKLRSLWMEQLRTNGEEESKVGCELGCLARNSLC